MRIQFRLWCVLVPAFAFSLGAFAANPKPPPKKQKNQSYNIKGDDCAKELKELCNGRPMGPQANVCLRAHLKELTPACLKLSDFIHRERLVVNAVNFYCAKDRAQFCSKFKMKDRKGMMACMDKAGPKLSEKCRNIRSKKDFLWRCVAQRRPSLMSAGCNKEYDAVIADYERDDAEGIEKRKAEFKSKVKGQWEKEAAKKAGAAGATAGTGQVSVAPGETSPATPEPVAPPPPPPPPPASK